MSAKVVVFGGAGFLGSHLVQKLLERDYEVVVIDNLCSGRMKHIRQIESITGKQILDFYNVDVSQSTSRALWTGILHRFNPDYVYNYIAIPYIPDSYTNPVATFETNALFPVYLVEACGKLDVPLLQVSSAEIYGLFNKQDKPYPLTECEDYILPRSTYGVSKLAIDHYIEQAWIERKIKAISLRQFNCIGERETHPYVVPEIMTQVSKQLAHREIALFLGNNSSRDFMYAGDAVNNAIQLLEHCTKMGTFGGAYNCGSEFSISVYDLANAIIQMLGYKGLFSIHQDKARFRKNEIWHLQASTAKLQTALGTTSICPTKLVDALRATWNDYRDNDFKWSWEQ